MKFNRTNAEAGASDVLANSGTVTAAPWTRREKGSETTESFAAAEYRHREQQYRKTCMRWQEPSRKSLQLPTTLGEKVSAQSDCRSERQHACAVWDEGAGCELPKVGGTAHLWDTFAACCGGQTGETADGNEGGKVEEWLIC